MAFQARTIKDMLGGLYDLVALHGTEDDLTAEQRNTIRKLYNEIKPYDRIVEKAKEADAHAAR